MASQDQSPDGPYHPGPGLGHELGVMFGFMAAFALTMGGYLVIWKIQNRKSLSRELSRREALTARGYGPNEKARSSIAYGDPLYEDDNNNNNTHLHDRDEEGIAPPAAAEVHGQTAPKGELDGLNTEKKAVAGEMSAEREPVEVEAVR